MREVVHYLKPTSLDQIVFDDFGRLSEHRVWLDQKIIDWIAGLSDGDLDFVLSYSNTKGVPAKKRYSSLLLHFFNDQTPHHQGSGFGLVVTGGCIDIGVTDLLAQIPEETSCITSRFCRTISPPLRGYKIAAKLYVKNQGRSYSNHFSNRCSDGSSGAYGSLNGSGERLTEKLPCLMMRGLQ